MTLPLPPLLHREREREKTLFSDKTSDIGPRRLAK